MAHWIDNADSYICSHCGYEISNPNKEALGHSICPRCFAEMKPKEVYTNGKYTMIVVVE